MNDFVYLPQQLVHRRKLSLVYARYRKRYSSGVSTLHSISLEQTCGTLVVLQIRWPLVHIVFVVLNLKYTIRRRNQYFLRLLNFLNTLNPEGQSRFHVVLYWTTGTYSLLERLPHHYQRLKILTYY